MVEEGGGWYYLPLRAQMRVVSVPPPQFPSIGGRPPNLFLWKMEEKEEDGSNTIFFYIFISGLEFSDSVRDCRGCYRVLLPARV